MIDNPDTLWWQKAVFYHIYPQSFFDTNGDGIGDLEGIRCKLDYLQELGIDAIWLSPVYPSPLVDEGYDVADYTGIHPRYGTRENFSRLVKEAHLRGIRVIMDLVLNHTSHLHPWFKEACSSPENPRRDWYLWHPGRKGGKPNNWLTNFGQSAWKRDETSGQYYYHSFFAEQPDLNWRNPRVRKAMFNIIRFWLFAGVDGFRLDVANLLFKHRDYPDNPGWALVNDKHVYNRNQPETYELLRQFRQLLDKYPGRIGIGEIYVSPPGNPSLAASFTGNGSDMLHLAFDFSLLFTRWSAGAFKRVIRRYYRSLPAGGWPCFVLSNHDLGRAVNHYLFPINKEAKAKLLATLQLTLRGTPFIYYGDETGTPNRWVSRRNIRDRYGKLLYPFYRGRDKARTPMVWDATANAGFTTGTPWLPVHSPDTGCDVESQQNREDSVWHHYRSLLLLRKSLPVLQTGDISFLSHGRPYLLYRRSAGKEQVWIAVNFSFLPIRVKEWNEKEGSQILHSTHRKRIGIPVNGSFRLMPFEAVILGK